MKFNWWKENPIFDEIIMNYIHHIGGYNYLAFVFVCYQRGRRGFIEYEYNGVDNIIEHRLRAYTWLVALAISTANALYLNNKLCISLADWLKEIKWSICTSGSFKIHLIELPISSVTQIKIINCWLTKFSWIQLTVHASIKALAYFNDTFKLCKSCEFYCNSSI